MLKLNRIVLMISLFFLNALHGAQILSVPFFNVPLAPDQVIHASYVFGRFSLMFCYTNGLPNIGLITWPLNGAQYTKLLPIYLKINPIFDGKFADSSGNLTLQNNQNEQIVLSCALAY